MKTVAKKANMLMITSTNLSKTQRGTTLIFFTLMLASLVLELLLTKPPMMLEVSWTTFLVKAFLVYNSFKIWSSNTSQ